MNIKRLKRLLVVIAVFVCVIVTSAFSVSAEEKKFYLGGNVLGFTIDTQGVTVVGINEVITEGGLVSPCKKAGIIVGDVILSFNEKVINTPLDVTECLESYNGGEMVTKLLRDGEVKLVDLTPAKDLTGEYKLGIYLQDLLNGLGTVTYYNEDGSFASLGHPISDERGRVYDVVGGDIYTSSVIGVNKAEKGRAGELKGMFIGEKPIGIVEKNSRVGLYGKMNKFKTDGKIEVELSKGVPGKAQIYSTVDGLTPKFYSIEIVKADYISGSYKNFVIKITDKTLLEKTGGILQGMSGSPIVQNGKLIGAVTHVFLNDSTRGYGIAIQNMI
ncbi:MAG: PDZ domain-containing protein [Clostridia bacterium]|nr:PDZ domain-containing protein [Clostridia bacterium]